MKPTHSKAFIAIATAPDSSGAALAVLGIETPAECARRVAGNITRSPEARLFAAAKAEALFQIAVEERRARPDIDIPRLRASVTGLDSVKWRTRRLYASSFDVWAPSHQGPALREVPPT